MAILSSTSIYILGFDLATHHAGACLLGGEECLYTSSWKADGTDSVAERLSSLADWICCCLDDALDHLPPDTELIVASELPFSAPKAPRTIVVLAQALGYLQCLTQIWARRTGVVREHVMLVSPAAAKMALTGHGHASKTMVRRLAMAIAGRELTQDEADALAVALGARAKLEEQRLAGREVEEGI